MQHNIPKPVLKNSVLIPSTTDRVEPPPRKLLDRVSDAIRVKNYSYQTEKSYVQRVRCFILFHNKRHPIEMGGIAFTGLRTWTWRSSSSIAELNITRTPTF